MLVNILLTILVAIVIYLIVIYRQSAKKLAELEKYFPSPPRIPILGNLFLFAGKTPPGEWKFQQYGWK
jgi:hypothetical protein